MPKRNLTLIHQPSNTVLAKHLAVADNFFSRLRGLMFSKHLPSGSALLIKPCQQVHTHFMRYSIDIIFTDQNLKVLHIIPAMRPWRFSKYIKESHCVIELPVGSVGMVKVGDSLGLN